MNFREELRKKKYNILEYKKVEEILSKVLKYFEEECFEKLDFSEKKINFLYTISEQSNFFSVIINP